MIIAYGGLITSPAVAAIRQTVQQPPVQKTQKQVSRTAAQFGHKMADVRKHLGQLARQGLKGQALADLRKHLKADADNLGTLDTGMQQKFAATRAMIKSHHLPDVIAQREAKAESHYKSEMAGLKKALAAIQNQSDATQAATQAQAVLKHLAQFKNKRSQQPFDPKHLPNQALQPDHNRVPRTTKAQFQQTTTDATTPQFSTLSTTTLDTATTTTTSATTPTAAATTTAATTSYDVSQLKGADDPAYLAATTEVTLSDTIKAKAAELDHDPVKIYNWVHNNIVWQPTWGAIQSADLTLSAKRGNAFDISSLLIALLRASHIPARYVHGTIDVPEAKFRNWIGGFKNISAALNFASSGGIPITGIISGGKVTTVQMEHIWVEAAIDYVPTRGVKNRVADTWVPLDASYKQYTFQQGLDPIAISGIDPKTLATDFVNSGTVNDSEGWATGFDPTILQNAQTQMQTSLQDYISQNLPNATVGDVIGGRTIVEQHHSGLSASLANPIVAVGTRFASVALKLEQSMTFGFGRDVSGYPLQEVSYPFAAINNQRITLSFKPATQADQDALASLLPDGDITDISQLPTSIPAYLVQVVPQLKINGQVVMTGDPMNLGYDLTFDFDANFIGHGLIPHTYTVAAGAYLAVAAIGGSVSPQALADTKARLETTKAILDSQDPTQLQGLTREDLLGDLFETGVLGYYAQYNALTYVAGLRQGGQHMLAAGMGSFGYEPNVTYVFGVPTDIHGGGAVMNVPIQSVFGYDQDGTDAGKEARLNYVLQSGTISSALEGAVPEQMFVTPDNPGEAISAVKALAKANAAGQHIYHITKANEDQVLPLIHHSAPVMKEIKDALAAGKEVITHTDAVSVPGWSGAGYIIYDPQTGDGAYKIAGGQNGSYLAGLFLGLVISVFVIALISSSGGVLLPLLLGIFAFAGFLSYFLAEDSGGLNQRCFISGIFAGLAPLGLVEAALYGGPISSVLAIMGYSEIDLDLTGSRASCGL